MHRKSPNVFGKFIWAILIIALFFGGFVAYERWWGTPEFKEKVAEIQQTTGKVLGSATEWMKDTMMQSAKEKTGDIIVSASDSLEQYGTNLKTAGSYPPRV